MQCQGVEELMEAMPVVRGYREALHALQADWRNLGVLGQITGAVAAMEGTRLEFQQLSAELLKQLACELRRKALAGLQAKAQVAINTLVRNLFERTADIGFLATDADVQACLSERGDTGATRRRLAAYRGNYTVYADIVLFQSDGEIAVRLDEGAASTRSDDPAIEAALRSTAPYHEAFGSFDFLPGQERTLVYTRAVRGASLAPCGVLALCFAFRNEMARIFGALLPQDGDAVGVLLDEHGTVVASSDAFHIAPGAGLARLLDADGAVVMLRGSEYLVACRRATPFQGYGGPPWRCAVLMPVRNAFRARESIRRDGLDPAVQAELLASTSLFDETLRSIPVRAAAIQRELARSVWNGSLQQGDGDGRFSRVLCGEIGKVASETRDVFTRSMSDLQQTIVAGVLQECAFLSTQLADLLDRNLYERANDCRWWALDTTIRDSMAAPQPNAEAVQAVLERIHALYTVYTNLVVFDASGTVVAVSAPAHGALVGSRLAHEWVRRTLALRASTQYTISAFEPTILDGGEAATFIYGAAIRSPDQARVTGGLAAVFDARAQLAGMLGDVVGPAPGAIACLVQHSGRVLASTGWPQGVPASGSDADAGAVGAHGDTLHGLVRSACAGGGIVRLGGDLYAMGASRSPGYREYDGRAESARTACQAVVMLPLGGGSDAAARLRAAAASPRIEQGAGPGSIEIGTFRIGDSWYGLRTEHVVRAIARQAQGAGSRRSRHFAGLQLHEERPLPLFELPVEGGCEGERQEVVVVAAPAGKRFGLLVDELGGVLRVQPAQRRELPPSMCAAATLTEGLVCGSEGMLQLLAVERVVAALAGAGIASAPP